MVEVMKDNLKMEKDVYLFIIIFLAGFGKYTYPGEKIKYEG